MSAPYDNAYVVFGHGADGGHRRRLPDGVCVVTFMQCGALADVYGQVDTAYRLFSNQRIRDALLNPGDPENKQMLEKSLFGQNSTYKITVSEGPHDSINDFSFSLFLSSPDDDDDDTGWLVKSGLYKYPIRHGGKFKIDDDIDMHKMTREIVEPAYTESIYPTQAQIHDLMRPKLSTRAGEFFEFFDLQDDMIVPNYPLSIWDIINDTKGLGTRGASGNERIVIFNPVCRDFAPQRYQMRKTTRKKTIAARRSASAEKQELRAKRGLSSTTLGAVREQNEGEPSIGELEELTNGRASARNPRRKAASASGSAGASGNANSNSNNDKVNTRGCFGRTWNGITRCLKRLLTARQRKMVKFVKAGGRRTRKNRR
jgi:hypothetical protein